MAIALAAGLMEAAAFVPLAAFSWHGLFSALGAVFAAIALLMQL